MVNNVLAEINALAVPALLAAERASDPDPDIDWNPAPTDRAHVIATTRALAEGTADPYLVIATMIEAALLTLVQRIPKHRRSPVGLAILVLLINRLRAHGLS